MDSSDEEDVHQCGRCKEIFHSIDEYFLHKKSKVCKKPKDGAGKEVGDGAGGITTANNVQTPAVQVQPEVICPQHASDEVQGTDDSIASETVPVNENVDLGSREKTTLIGNEHASEGADRDACASETTTAKQKLVKLEDTSGNDASNIDKNLVEEGAKTIKQEQEDSTPEVDPSCDEDLSRKRKRKARPKKLMVLSDEEHDIDDDPEFTPKRPKVEPVTSVTKRRRGRPRRSQEAKKKPKFIHEPITSPRTPSLRKKRGRPPKDFSVPSPEPTPATTVTVFACPLCTYTTECRDELDRHLRREHKMSLHSCEFCKKSFSDKYKLQKHILDSKCQYNTGVFPGVQDRYGLETSILEEELGSDDDADMTLEEEQQKAKTKTGPLFKCYECDAICDSFLEIHGHLLKHHYDERRCNPAICELCGKWFGSKDRFWRHLTATIHDDIPDEDIRRIKGESYNLKFTWKLSLKKPNQRVFDCEHCDKTFKYREAFNKHMKYVHPEDGKLLQYKFSCSSCKQQFNHRRTYLTHLKTEHGIKDGGPEDFKCPVCVKTFKQKAHKYRHIESLHTPIQIVPDSIIPMIESERYHLEMAAGSQMDENREIVEEKSDFSTDAQKTSPELMDEQQGDNSEGTRASDAETAKPAQEQNEGDDEGFSEGAGQDIGKDDKLRESTLKKDGEDVVELKLDRDENETDTPSQDKEQSEISNNVLEISGIIPKLKKTKKNVSESVATWLGCPVCSEKLTSRPLLLRHMQLHRVWILRTEKGIATEGVQGVYDALNLRMPNIPQGLTDRETGLAIQDVLVHKTGSQGVAIPQPEEHFNTAVPTGFNPTSDQHNVALENTFIQDPLQKEAGLNTIDQSIIRDLVLEEPKETVGFAVTTDRAIIYKTVQKIVQDIKIKQLIGGNDEDTENAAQDATDNTDDADEASFVCPFCVKVHKSLSDCYKHVTSTHSMAAAFQCIRKGCRLVFGNVHDYEKHAEVHQQSAFMCRVCNFHFEEMLDAVSHKSSAHRSLHQTEVNRCDLCNRTFASKEALTKHVAMDKHHHQCGQCGKVMKNASDLKDHEMTHRGIRSYLCDQCGAAFANRLHLSRHRRLHNAVPKCLQCDQCTATFAKREHLKRHLQTQHTDEKPFACQYPGCDKAFKRKDKLQDHYRMHSNETPYQCAICGKAYRYREALKYHEKTHLKECKHFCTMCDAGFPRPAALRAHLKEKHQISLKHQHSYPCPQCGNVFSRPERLKRHMEFRHSVAGDWKFKCPVCSRGCAGKKSFHSHMLKKHSLEGTLEQLMNIDVTPYMSVEKQRRKRENRPKIEIPVAQPAEMQQQLHQLPQQQHLQPQPQQQQTMQIRVEDGLAPSVATAIIQPQQTHQSITIQNPQDPTGTIYLIPSANISDKDPLMQNMVGFQQLVLPTNAIQGHSAQTQQINTQHANQAVIHNTMQNVTLTGAATGMAHNPAGPAQTVGAPLHTVLMTTHPTIQRPEATTASINLQQVTTGQVVQPHNTFSTISSSYSGFVNNYDQY